MRKTNGNSEPINLWYDDWRPAPPGWVWAKTTKQAIQLMETRVVNFASLDHDISGDSLQGSDFVDWMEQHNIWPLQIPMVHSANPDGKFYMERVIAKHYFGPEVANFQCYLQGNESIYYLDRRGVDYRKIYDDARRNGSRVID